jgi:hypothetical protein
MGHLDSPPAPLLLDPVDGAEEGRLADQLCAGCQLEEQQSAFDRQRQEKQVVICVMSDRVKTKGRCHVRVGRTWGAGAPLEARSPMRGTLYAHKGVGC